MEPGSVDLEYHITMDFDCFTEMPVWSFRGSFLFECFLISQMTGQRL